MPWLSFRGVIPHVAHGQRLGDCIDRDKTETSTKYFQDLFTIKAEMKTGIGRKLTTVQRYTRYTLRD